ncbi:MAG: hypothetical protein HY303_08745 [Candidatus Wallbacteria bacterium]|nr:hypothetical protein [Candidatus Wallbacteria bacterium]
MRRKVPGFSLVEVLLAAAVAALAIVPLAGSFTTATLGTQQVVQTTRAVELASSRLELLRGRPFAEVAALPAVSVLPAAELGRPCEGEMGRVDLVPGELVRIAVRVRWSPSPKLLEKVELATFYLNARAR